MDNVRLAYAYGKIDREGNLHIHDREGFLKRVGSLTEMNVELIVVKRDRSFSDSQRKYYFSVVVPHMHTILINEGHYLSKDETDQLLREKFLYREYYDSLTEAWKKELCRLSNDNSDVTKEEFQQFLNNIEQFAVENFNASFPSPTE